MVNIEGLNKAKVLIALYEHARVQGMGHFAAQGAKTIEIEDAEELLKVQTYFDYFNGRVMKVDLKSNKEFDPRLYDRDNGLGAAEAAVAGLRK
jgi:hypothetical protein